MSYTGPVRELSIEERRTIIARVLSPRPLSWEAGDFAYIECPGKDLHSNSNGRRDCRVYASEAPGRTVKPPGIYCLHTSCAAAIAPLNFAIRSALGKAKVAGLDRGPAGSGGSAGAARPTPSASGSTPAAHSPGNDSRTGRTSTFKAPPKGGDANLRTGRTGISKPLVCFARAHVRAHVSVKTAPEPSGPSGCATPDNPVAKTPPATGTPPVPVPPRRPAAAARPEPKPGYDETGARVDSTFVDADGVDRVGRWINGVYRIFPA